MKRINPNNRVLLQRSFEILLRYVGSHLTHDDLRRLLRPLFSRSDRGIASLTIFAHGVFENWEDIKHILYKKGSEFMVQVIENAYQNITTFVPDFWIWLNQYWQIILRASLSLIGGLACSVGGGMMGGKIGLLVAGPAGIPIGAGIGGFVGGMACAIMGDDIGIAVAREMGM